MNIGYCRISTADNLDVVSLQNQEKIIQSYATIHGIRVDRIYSEIISGAVEFSKRPVMSKVLNELKSGSKLIVSRLCRLSRRLLSTLEIINQFEKEKKELVIADLGNVHKDNISKILVSVLSMVAEIERDNVSHRQKIAKEIAKKENRYLGGYVQFGWQKSDNGTLKPNQKELEIFQSIINLRKSKVPIRSIAEVIRAKHGRKLHYSFISKILNRPHNFEVLNLQKA